MIISADIFLPLDGKKPLDIVALKTELLYPNPKLQDAKRLGLYTKNIPPTIQNFSITLKPHGMRIPRGEFKKIKKFFPYETVQEQFERYPETLKQHIVYTNPDFELDIRQRRAVEATYKKKQGIIHAATSAGKSAIIMAIIAFRRTKTVIVVHRKTLLEQLRIDAERWLVGTRIAVLSGTDDATVKAVKEADVVLAIDKSLGNLLKKDPSFAEEFGMVIQDECHLAASTTFQNIICKLKAPFRFGLTGTLKRKDRLDFLIYSTFGDVIATITKEELLEADRVSPVKLAILHSDTEVPSELFELSVTEKFQKIEQTLAFNRDRQQMIADEAMKLHDNNPDARIVILSRLVDPCYELGGLISCRGYKVRYVTGKEKEAFEQCEALKRGDARIMIATIGCFATGVNIPNLTDLILAAPIFNNELLIHQIRGRLMRKSEGKTHGTMHFIWDPYVFPPHALIKFKSIMNK